MRQQTGVAASATAAEQERESASRGKSDAAAEESEGSETETDCAGVSCRESEGRQGRRVAARVREGR